MKVFCRVVNQNLASRPGSNRLHSNASQDDIRRWCKEKGFARPSSEIYGGDSGFFDFGPLGAIFCPLRFLNVGLAVRENIKKLWWKHFVLLQNRVHGIDTSLMHPKV